ncbi:uncharacterized protein MYCFIDRAFT_178814 [Pseudocercospora fijiensis CIRAD86]|uniref:Uncharacterized protein n=1 Tax=Pseudocercospora fijiensis (strain CIRAD86) TaxID=383855 RepID=M3AMM8_PSEFD|nr:uncharacterized protein MYCFIDRAFT_178814 [Pseudocercospora fijiensis CIRAD86]EME78702.1 hypothetical protein MYCFIDRAFT_178814 [Pseudocercospora fijiensis CIRAD86]
MGRSTRSNRRPLVCTCDRLSLYYRLTSSISASPCSQNVDMRPSQPFLLTPPPRLSQPLDANTPETSTQWPQSFTPTHRGIIDSSKRISSATITLLSISPFVILGVVSACWPHSISNVESLKAWYQTMNCFFLNFSPPSLAFA